FGHPLKQAVIRCRADTKGHRVTAIAIRVFGGDDIVADLQCRLHRAGGDVVGAGNRRGGNEHHANTDGRFLEPVKHLLHYGFCHVLALGDRSSGYIGADETFATLDAPPPRLPHAPPMIELTQEFGFDAPHYLSDIAPENRRLHGHSYYAEVTLRGTPTPKTGFLRDLGDVKAALENIL